MGDMLGHGARATSSFETHVVARATTCSSGWGGLRMRI